jgi:hypothetical protein
MYEFSAIQALVAVSDFPLNTIAITACLSADVIGEQSIRISIINDLMGDRRQGIVYNDIR